MIDKKNWRLAQKYLDYRFEVDQISKGSLKKEQVHIRHLIEWAQDKPFHRAMGIRPTFPEYMLSARLDGENGQLSAGYIKKTLATARLFFIWLSDNEAGYKHIKQSWIKTVKNKRSVNTPKNTEAVSLEEVLTIAARPAQAAQARRARAAMVFLFLSGMRIGAFVSLPLQAVNIRELTVNQFPSLGVRTKLNKSATTYLWDIPELLKVVQDWDDEVRAILPPIGFWFAPLSSTTGEIDPSIKSIGEHRITLARKNFKAWLEQEDLPYHSPHKFRHGHIQYGNALATNISQWKAVSQNAMHTSMKITDATYSNLQDKQVKSIISGLNKSENPTNDTQAKIQEIKRLLAELENKNPA